MVCRDLTPSPQRVAIMRWTARMGAVTAEALADRTDVTVASARSRLGALARGGWLSRARPLANRPALYTATRVGLRVSGLRGLDACRVSATNAQHLIVCAWVAAMLERCYPDHRVLGERELRRDERECGRTLASARLGTAGGKDRQLLHRPDLVLSPLTCAQGEDDGAVADGEDCDDDGGRGDGRNDRRGHGYEYGYGDRMAIAVEVELTIKAPERLTEICRAWARCQTVGGVLYIAPPEVQRALERAIERAQANEQIVVVGLDALGSAQSTVPSGA